MDIRESSACIAYRGDVHGEMILSLQITITGSCGLVNAYKLAVDSTNAVRETATTTKIIAQKSILEFFYDLGHSLTDGPRNPVALEIPQCLNESQGKVVIGTVRDAKKSFSLSVPDVLVRNTPYTVQIWSHTGTDA